MKPSLRYLICILVYIFLLQPLSVYATNQLTIQDPDIWGSTKPGYIDKATLVVEPYGGYVIQSLYLTYSDHNQFAPGSKLELVHRFELPEGAVVTDLWLWIGDSVMQAIMLDTWTARAIYDSIVVVKRDPAFLTKEGNQYELHVYPLKPGQQRRIKITFITPTKWFAETATAEGPLKFINAGDASIQPLEIFFKETADIWGKPNIAEVPNATFQDFVDTLGFRYKFFLLDDSKKLPSLNLQYETNFTAGNYFDSFKKQNDYTYFQLGISPGKFFNLTKDTTSYKYLIGLDISGDYYRNLETLIPNMKEVLKSSLKPYDKFKLLVTGNGAIKEMPDNWLTATPGAIDSLLDEFASSDFADSIKNNSRPTIIYCDDDAVRGWTFPGIEKYASVLKYPNIETAWKNFGIANIIAAYQHGFDNPMSEGTLQDMLAPLDSFFTKGGRLLSYFDFNRDGKELLASHYINGLHTLDVTHGPVKLYRNINGNIGRFFPESFTRESSYFLAYNDSSVKVELTDEQGRPSVISKRIKQGLLVVSGIWQLNDDGAMKTMLDIPLLGLNKSSEYFQLEELLNTIRNEFNSNPFNKVLLFSNSDSLYQTYDAKTFVNSYLQSFTSGRPVFNTINLLEADNFYIPSVSVDNVDYYGSGLFTKILSDSTHGIHFETHVNDWNYISSVLSSDSYPLYDSFDVTFAGDTNLYKIIDMIDINKIKNDPNRPLFFIGTTTAADSIEFKVSARYPNESTSKDIHLSFQISRDTTGDVIPAMIGNEKINNLFATASYDTAAIVRLAMKYHLLCDYTALLALEPNDTLHYLRDYNDEGNYFTDISTKNNNETDSLSLDIYPNPFNIRTTIVLNIVNPSSVRLQVFNILGQLVKTIEDADMISGRKVYYWNSRNSINNTVSSGVYFVRAIVKENGTGKTFVKLRKMVLLK